MRRALETQNVLMTAFDLFIRLLQQRRMSARAEQTHAQYSWPEIISIVFAMMLRA